MAAGITVDVVHPSSDLSGYKLIVAPNLYMVDSQTATNLSSYVADGGHLAMSFFSGIVDRNDRLHEGGYPGPFRELLGLEVDEFWPLPEGVGTGLAFADGDNGVGSVWSEWIDLKSATAVASFVGGDLDGLPAITRNTHGDGVGWYLGTRPDNDTMDAMMARIATGAGVAADLPGLPPGVEAVSRYGQDGTRHLFLLNHTSVPVDVAAPGRTVHLGPGEVTVCSIST